MERYGIAAMCTNRKWITNPYTKKRLLVPCGKCPACKQQKADRRSERIRNNFPDDGSVDCRFFGLTYRDECVPYVRISDIRSSFVDFDEKGNTVHHVPIYRNYDLRWVRCNKEQFELFDGKKMIYNKSGIYMINKQIPLGSFDSTSFTLPITSDGKNTFTDFSSVDALPRLVLGYRDKAKKIPILDDDRVGIAYYKDLQNFFKRLRIILKRSYNYENNFSFFACSEFGSTSGRPHFHVLIFFPKGYDTLFEHAICQAWSFDDYDSIRKQIEPPIDAASYVSSYVNSDNSASIFFESTDFRQKHSYSHGFGMAKDFLSLSEVQKAFVRRDFGYDVEIASKSGFNKVHRFIPQYALGRYFFKFKGFNRLTNYQIYDVFERPENISRYRERCELSEEDCYRIIVAIRNKQKLWLSHGFTIDDFARFSTENQTVRSSNVLRYSLECSHNWFYHYDNIIEYYSGEVRSDSLDDEFSRLDPNFNYIIDPNEFPFYCFLDDFYTARYFKYNKDKKVRNSIYKLSSNV